MTGFGEGEYGKGPYGGEAKADLDTRLQAVLDEYAERGWSVEVCLKRSGSSYVETTGPYVSDGETVATIADVWDANDMDVAPNSSL